MAVEGIVERVRLRILDKIRYADLASIENIGRAPIYNAVSTHALNISNGAVGVISAVTGFILLCWASLVILYIRLRRFCFWLGLWD